jgi:cyclophilin family peptidyl-prolyl cis-trans isomerase
MTDRRRRQKEQRAAKRETERKQSARRELWRRLGIAVGFGGLIVAILVVGSIFGPDEGSVPSSYEGYRGQETACGGTPPEPEVVMEFDSPEEQDDLGDGATAMVTTSCGDITIELDPEGFPETVNSFVFLARAGFYDGQVFHRIVPDFVAQGGDPQADGTGGPGYDISDEFPDDDFEYETGVVAMANRGRGTTGSQFFIVLGDAARVLTNQFNIVGRVTDGFDTLEAIAGVELTNRPNTNETSLPLETVYIEEITIETGT